mmetsp:Transcript_11676/g.14537  ORF Transcript_11676/g.14537 Transcript_11676/m.14537 type:complete len:94 (+) Transcript_11676:1752-2033(+)
MALISNAVSQFALGDALVTDKDYADHHYKDHDHHNYCKKIKRSVTKLIDGIVHEPLLDLHPEVTQYTEHSHHSHRSHHFHHSPRSPHARRTTF